MGLLQKLFSPQPKPAAAWQRPPALFHVSASWLQPATLRSAGFTVDVVGESFYQEALDIVGGGRTPTGAAVPYVTAQLVREPSNPHDRDAVRVDIGNLPVGHIPRDEAPDYHDVLAQLARLERPATCRAWITGGWDRGRLDQGSYGVQLDLHPDLELSSGSILPGGSSRVTVTGEEKHQSELASLVASGSHRDVIALLAFEGDRIAVSIHGQPVGILTAKMTERYAGWVNEVEAVGLPATCDADITQGDKKLEVSLFLARPWDSRDAA